MILEFEAAENGREKEKMGEWATSEKWREL